MNKKNKKNLKSRNKDRKIFFKEIRTRLIWLLLGLGLSLLTAVVIRGFEEVLQDKLILASFIPLIVYMSDAVGTQMEAIVIREISSPKTFHFLKFAKKQLMIVIPVAIIVSIVAGTVVFVIDDELKLALVVGISLLGGICSSLVTGVMMPYIFWKTHNDPAEASGPLATVIQDFISILIFLALAQAFY